MIISGWLMFAVACGPEAIAPPEQNAAGTGGMVDASTGTEPGGVSGTSGLATGTGDLTDGGSTSGTRACLGERGELLHLGYLKLQQPSFLVEQPLGLEGEFTCTVVAVEETDDFFLSKTLAWTTRLQCEGLEELEVVAEQDVDMFEPSWVGRTVTLSADAFWGFTFHGWYAVRDERGELLFAYGTSFPPAAATAPFTVERIDLGENCESMEDCLIVYEHAVTFTSEADGTLRCHDRGGHATDQYWVEGSSTYYENPDPPPFGECVVGDDPSGAFSDYFRILRRPGR